MSAFDNLQRIAFNAVHRPFGDVATWTPYAGGDAQTAKVFFNNPTATVGFGVASGNTTERVKGFPDFDPDKPVIEYLKGDFEGLKESANDKNREIITVNGTQYRVSKVTTKWDGKSHFASLIQL